MSLKKWIKKDERTVMKNDHWSYRIDKFVIEGGEEGEYHYVHTNGASMVIPVTSEGNIVLVKQFRYLNQTVSAEFPCGGVEDGISVEENAIKELREETGYDAENIEYLGKFSTLTGACDEYCHVYIATDLKVNPLPPDDTEDIEVEKVTYDQLCEMIEKNYIYDGLTISAYTLARKRLEQILEQINV